MGVIILKAEELNLPEAIAKKLRGRKVEITDEGGKIYYAYRQPNIEGTGDVQRRQLLD